MKLERLVIHWLFYLQGQIQEGSNNSINERWNRQRGKIGKVELNRDRGRKIAKILILQWMVQEIKETKLIRPIENRRRRPKQTCSGPSADTFSISVLAPYVNFSRERRARADRTHARNGTAWHGAYDPTTGRGSIGIHDSGGHGLQKLRVPWGYSTHHANTPCRDQLDARKASCHYWPTERDTFAWVRSFNFTPRSRPLLTRVPRDQSTFPLSASIAIRSEPYELTISRELEWFEAQRWLCSGWNRCFWCPRLVKLH